MALGSQSTETQAITDLTGLAHEVFSEDVKWQVRAESPTSQLFGRAQRRADYRVQGEALVGAAQLRYANGAMATGGKLPDHIHQDAVQWQITPVRRYRRIARDPFTAARATGDGAFEDFTARIFDQLWDSWGRMEIRHAIGDSRGYVALCDSRDSQTKIHVKDGYGHAGTNPMMHIEPKGTTLAWLDASNTFAVGGAAKVDSVDWSNYEITFDSDFDDGSTTIASDDPVVMATTDDSTASHFETEYNNAPNGVGDILDPDDNLNTVFNINETTHERWKPFRQSSSTFDQFELAEHWRALKSYSNAPVTAGTHTAVAQSAPVSELARTLGPYQQQQQMGRTFEGGYTAVRISFLGGQPMDFVEDDYFYHDVVATLCYEDMYRADLEGDADFYDNDGSMWSRLPDEDKEEAYVREYLQCWADRRNRMAALTDITLSNVDADTFSPVPR
ncbi:MAG: hypothetical protein ACOC8B_05185 [Gemmatimonadota bacterium]